MGITNLSRIGIVTALDIETSQESNTIQCPNHHATKPPKWRRI